MDDVKENPWAGMNLGFRDEEVLEAIELGMVTRSDLRRWFAIADGLKNDKRLTNALERLVKHKAIRFNHEMRYWEVM